MDAELQEFEYEPEILTGTDYWVPTIEQFEKLTDITDDRTRSYEEKVLYNKGVEHQQNLNAEIKTKNDIMKKARDEIIFRGVGARQDIISTLLGAILEDEFRLTTES